MEIQVKEIFNMKKCLNKLFVGYIGKLEFVIGKDIDCDNFLYVVDVKKYGLIDEVLIMCDQFVFFKIYFYVELR